MIKSNFNEEYKAPKCKVVALTLGAACLLNDSNPNSVESAQEENYGDY